MLDIDYPPAAHCKNAEVERLAAQVAKMANESKTEAIRVALTERVSRLKMGRSRLPRDQQIDAVLARFRQEFPEGDFGRKLSKAEEEKILGFGPGGV